MNVLIRCCAIGIFLVAAHPLWNFIRSEPLPAKTRIKGYMFLNDNLTPTGVLNKIRAEWSTVEKLRTFIGKDDTSLFTVQQLAQLDHANIFAKAIIKETHIDTEGKLQRNTTTGEQNCMRALAADLARHAQLTTRTHEQRIYKARAHLIRHESNREKIRAVINAHIKKHTLWSNLDTKRHIPFTKEETKFLKAMPAMTAREEAKWTRTIKTYGYFALLSLLLFMAMVSAAGHNPIEYMIENQADAAKLMILPGAWFLWAVVTWELHPTKRYSQRNDTSYRSLTLAQMQARNAIIKGAKAMMREFVVRTIKLAMPNLFALALSFTPAGVALAKKASSKKTGSTKSSKKQDGSDHDETFSGSFVGLLTLADNSLGISVRAQAKRMFSVGNNVRIGPAAMMVAIPSAFGFIPGVGIRLEYDKWLTIRTLLRWKLFAQFETKDKAASWSHAPENETTITLTPRWNWGQAWLHNFFWISESSISGLHMWRVWPFLFARDISLGIHVDWYTPFTKAATIMLGGWIGISNCGITVACDPQGAGGCQATLEALLAW